jgi:hypothetical protein
LRNIATELLSKFSRVGLREQKQPDAWAKKSYEIAVKIAYENGNLRGTPKGQARDCREVPVNEQQKDKMLQTCDNDLM